MKCLHHNDIDGRCSGAIVAAFENNYNPKDYIELDYIKKIPLDIIKKDEKVYIVDYSISINEVDQLEELLKITKNIIWIDHHQSTFDLIRKYPKFDKLEGLRKQKISGAALTYMYLYNKNKLEDCPKYIQLVSDFDCWVYKFGKETTEFIFGVQCHDYSVLSSFWMFIEDESIDEIKEKGKIAYDYARITNEDYFSKYGFECRFEDYKCIAINDKRNGSLIFGDLIENYDIAIIFAYDGDIISYSLFTTKDNINCGKIAEKYGGGGHPKAAGFTSNKLLISRR